MSSRRKRNYISVAFIVMVMTLSPIAGVIGAGGLSPTGVATADDSPKEYQVTDDVSVWEEAVLPLRADTTDAPLVIENKNIDLYRADGAVADANRDFLTVSETGDVSLTFSGDGNDAVTDVYAEKDVQILAAHLEDDAELEDAPTSFQSLLDDLSEDGLERLNDNFTFELTDGEIDENGELEVEQNVGAGFHMFIVATGDGLDVSDADNELSIRGETTIVGVEHLIAQESKSDVSVTDEIDLGDDLTFDVNAPEVTDGSATHAVAVYDEATFSRSITEIHADKELSSDFTEEDITIKHQIEAINGVREVDGDAEMLGVQPDERSITGMTQVPEIIGFLSNDIDADDPNTEILDDTLTPIELEGSVTTIGNADANEEITVGTLEEWDGGEYRWVHVAMGESNDEIQMNTDTVELKDVEDDSSGSSGGSSGGGFTPPGTPPAEFTVDVDAPETAGLGDDAELEATITNTGERTGTQTVEMMIGEETWEEDVELSGDESWTWTGEFDTSELGDIDWEVSTDDDSEAGTLSVVEDPPVEDEPAALEWNVETEPAEPIAGDDVTVTVSAENTGEQTSDSTLEFRFDGAIEIDEHVALEGGETDTWSFTANDLDAGDYTWELIVDGTTEQEDTIVVESDDDGDDGDDDGIPGFGVSAALVALLAVVAATLRRKN
ncbi:PGF-CTERM sorting domain-containing protein [Natrialbaceae archaeon A-gly3]